MARRPKNAAAAAAEGSSMRDPLDAAFAMIAVNGWRKFNLVELAGELERAGSRCLYALRLPCGGGE